MTTKQTQNEGGNRRKHQMWEDSRSEQKRGDNRKREKREIADKRHKHQIEGPAARLEDAEVPSTTTSSVIACWEGRGGLRRVFEGSLWHRGCPPIWWENWAFRRLFEQTFSLTLQAASLRASHLRFVCIVRYCLVLSEFLLSSCFSSLIWSSHMFSRLLFTSILFASFILHSFVVASLLLSSFLFSPLLVSSLVLLEQLSMSHLVIFFRLMQCPLFFVFSLYFLLLTSYKPCDLLIT